jgi:hypothetical protein
MANKYLTQVDGGQTTITLNGIMYIALPAATPTGYQDYFIPVEYLLADVNADIYTLQIDLNNAISSITALQELMSKVVDLNKNANYELTVANTTVIEAFVLNWKAGTPSIKIGTTSGGSELSGMTINLSSTDKRYPLTVWYNHAETTAQTVYITISDGTVDITRFQRLSILTP